MIGASFFDLSMTFASVGHKLPLQNFRDLGPYSDCIKRFALTWGIVQERKSCEQRFKGITNETPEGIFYFLCLTIILQSNVFSSPCTCMLMIQCDFREQHWHPGVVPATCSPTYWAVFLQKVDSNESWCQNLCLLFHFKLS